MKKYNFSSSKKKKKKLIQNKSNTNIGPAVLVSDIMDTWID